MPFDQLLGKISESRAKTKLLCLELGTLTWAPNLGIVGERVPQLLEQLLASKESEENIFVLVSHRSTEQSHVSWSERRSVFGYYLCEALRGRAHAQDDEDGRIRLDELTQFVQSQVNAYVWRTNGQATQRPLLLKYGVGQVDAAEETIRNQIVANVPRAAEDGEAAEPDSKKSSASKSKKKQPDKKKAATRDSAKGKATPAASKGTDSDAAKGSSPAAADKSGAATSADSGQQPPEGTDAGGENTAQAKPPAAAAEVKEEKKEELDLEGLPPFEQQLITLTQRAAEQPQLLDHAPHAWVHFWGELLMSQNYYFAGEATEVESNRPQETLLTLDRQWLTWLGSNNVRYDLPDAAQRPQMQQALGQLHRALFKLSFLLKLGQAGLIDYAELTRERITELEEIVTGFQSVLVTDELYRKDKEVLLSATLNAAAALNDWCAKLEDEARTHADCLDRQYLWMETPFPSPAERLKFYQQLREAPPSLEVVDSPATPKAAQIKACLQDQLKRSATVSIVLQSLLELVTGREPATCAVLERRLLLPPEDDISVVLAELADSGREIRSQYGQLTDKAQARTADPWQANLALRLAVPGDWETLDAAMGRNTRLNIPIRLAAKPGPVWRIQSPSVVTTDRLPSEGVCSAGC